MRNMSESLSLIQLPHIHPQQEQGSSEMSIDDTSQGILDWFHSQTTVAPSRATLIANKQHFNQHLSSITTFLLRPRVFMIFSFPHFLKDAKSKRERERENI